MSINKGGSKPASSSKSPGKTENDARLQAIVDNVLDAIVTIDEKGTIEFANPATERLFGYSQKEMLGKNVKMLMPEPYHTEHDGYLSSYMHSGVAKIIGIGREVEGMRKDGSVFSLELAVTQMQVGKQRKFVGILRDISERKKSDEIILRQNESILELSTPVIQLWNGILLLPVIGVIDTHRAQQLIENLLQAIVESESSVAIMDLSGVPVIDTAVAQHIMKTVSATNMLGSEVIITGISPEIAMTLVKLNIEFLNIHTAASLQIGFKQALARLGQIVVNKETVA
ncbi:MAG: PAS domain S-box protein [Woeseiaceae bacterium]|nr:PAS domain S-box protein [Woeseiaceae bacterium]